MLSETKETYEFGPYRLDIGQHRFELSDGTSQSSLPEKAFQTLVFLVRNHGRLVTKNELLDAIWPDTTVEENNLNKSIHAIRQALGEKPRSQVYIETIPKHGYRFVAPVRRSGHAGEVGTRQNEFVSVSGRSIHSPAYDLYLRGRVKADSENREDCEGAIKILEAAIAIDPDLAGAYAQLARAYNTLAFKFTSSSKARLLHENAEVAILKSLALDPDLAEGHFARGLILWTSRKGFPHEQAIRSYKRSLELDPNSDETHHQLSMVYSHIGLLDEAHASVRSALEINPNNTMARFRIGVYAAYDGKFEEAMAAFKTIPRDVSPILVDRSTAEVLIQTGRLRDAEAIADNYLAVSPQDEGGSFTSVKALLLAKGAKRKEAEKYIESAIRIGKGFGHFHHTAHNIASANTALGKLDEALKWLEAAADDGFPNYTYFGLDPNLLELHSHPPFVAFMSKLRRRWKQFRNIAAQ